MVVEAIEVSQSVEPSEVEESLDGGLAESLNVHRVFGAVEDKFLVIL